MTFHEVLPSAPTLCNLISACHGRLESKIVNLENNLENTSALRHLQDRRAALECQIDDSIQEFAEDRDDISARYQAQRKAIIQQAQHQVAAAEQDQFHAARAWHIQMQARAEAERAAMKQVWQEAARISYLRILQAQAEGQRLAAIKQSVRVSYPPSFKHTTWLCLLLRISLF